LGLTRLTFFGVLWALTCFCFSQNEEKVAIHTHRTDFIVGEKIYLSASVHDITNDALSEISSVLYVEIRSAKGLSMEKLRLGIVNGLAHGEIFLDSKFDSDYYYLIAYTKWQKNFKAYSSKCISIINPYSKKTFQVDSTLSNIDKIQTPLSYEPESKHSLAIGNIKKGTYSIAIVQEYGAEKLPNTFHSSPMSESVPYYPETNYANLQGKLIDGQVKNQKVSLSFQSSDLQLSFSESSSEGDFLLSYNPDKIAGVGKILINEKRAPINLVNTFYNDLTLEPTVDLSISKHYFESIKSRAINSQIVDAYFEADSIIKQTKPFLPFDAKVYVLDEYKRFNSVRNTLIEIIFEIAASKNPDNFDLRVRGKAADSFEGSNEYPLILLDGIITDSKTVLNYPVGQLERIEVLTTTYYFGSIKYDGIISFHSKEKYIDRNFEDAIVLTKYQSFKPNYAKEVPLNDSRKPQLENTLYWEPFREVEDQALEIDFTTGTGRGLFKVSIMSHSEKGKEVYSNYFWVE